MSYSRHENVDLLKSDDVSNTIPYESVLTRSQKGGGRCPHMSGNLQTKLFWLKQYRMDSSKVTDYHLGEPQLLVSFRQQYDMYEALYRPEFTYFSFIKDFKPKDTYAAFITYKRVQMAV